MSHECVWLRDPFLPTTTGSVRARDMYLAHNVGVADVLGPHVLLKAALLTPLCDGGECCPTQLGVQMRVIADGAHAGKVVWVRNVHALARETYTLWMYDQWHRPSIAALPSAALVPEHAPMPCPDFPPTCVVTCRGEGRLLGYDNRTGRCRVDRRECTRALIRETHGFVGQDADQTRELLRQLGRCDPDAEEHLHWRVVVPLRMEYVPFGKRARLCGDAYRGLEVRVNGFRCGGAERRGVYASADGSGTVVDESVDLAAPAELLYSVETLHQYMIRVPPHVHALTFMVVSQAVSLRAVCTRDEMGLRCDQTKLRRALSELGETPATGWDALLDRCARAFADGVVQVRNATGAAVHQLRVGDDRDHLRLLVRSLRGLAQHCAAQTRVDAASASANTAAWRGGVHDPAQVHYRVSPRSARSAHKKKAKKRKRKKRKQNKKGKQHS